MTDIVERLRQGANEGEPLPELLDYAEREIVRLKRSEASLQRDYETALDERVGLQGSIGRALGYMDAGVYSVARDELRAGLAELDVTPEHHPASIREETDRG